MKSWIMKVSFFTASIAGAQQLAPVGPDPIPGSQLLFEQRVAEGISSDLLFRLCETYKAANRNQYFTVYCVFRDVNWNELRFGLESRTDYVFAGYSTDRTETGYGLRGVYISEHGEPVLIPVERRVWVPYLELRQASGLQVWGLGRWSELPWITEFTSLNPTEGYLSPVAYDDAEDASLRCLFTLADLRRDPSRGFLYAYSRCSVVPAGMAGFGYEIQVKNPFLQR